MFYITSQITFAAAHSLNNPIWSAEKNQEVYGKCAHPHGHNYTLQVTISGKLNPTTGMVINFTELKKILTQEIYEYVDHKDLNKDVDFLKNIIPTTENLARVFWERLVTSLPTFTQLVEVRVQESLHQFATYKGTI